MKRKSSFVLYISFLLIAELSVVCSACSSDDENNTGDSAAMNTEVYYIIGDCIKNLKDENGVVLKDHNNWWYIADSQNNRYYIYEVSTKNNLNDVLIEGTKVQFDGKVYVYKEEFIESFFKHDPILSNLLNEIKLYALVEPDFSIKKIERTQ